MPETTEYKDKRGENRIRHTADNGRITYASTQGYNNKDDMRHSAIQASIEIIRHYADNASEDQINDIKSLPLYVARLRDLNQ